MKILLDECVPWPLRDLLPDHQCSTPRQLGWGGYRNGELLALAENNFDLFITADQSIQYQQNLSDRRIAVLELSTNDRRRIEAVANEIATVVSGISPSEYRKLTIP